MLKERDLIEEVEVENNEGLDIRYRRSREQAFASIPIDRRGVYRRLVYKLSGALQIILRCAFHKEIIQYNRLRADYENLI